MATCEMCGESGDLKKTKVEGATLDLCEDCQEVGEVVSQPTAQVSSSSTSSRSTPSRQRDDDVEELVEDFNRRVKQARENRGLSVSELAQKVKEKESVIRRVESAKLSPDRKLATKLESALGVTLYEELSTPTGGKADTDEPSGGQTIGDVAEVRERD